MFREADVARKHKAERARCRARYKSAESTCVYPSPTQHMRCGRELLRPGRGRLGHPGNARDPQSWRKDLLTLGTLNEPSVVRPDESALNPHKKAEKQAPKGQTGSWEINHMPRNAPKCLKECCQMYNPGR